MSDRIIVCWDTKDPKGVTKRRHDAFLGIRDGAV